MDTQTLIPETAAAWLRASDFAPFVLSYWSHLDARGYKRSTARGYLACVAHFAHWCKLNQRNVGALCDADLIRFLDQHLPNCHCPAPVQRTRHMLRTAVRHFFEVLRLSGVTRSALAERPEEAILERFATYLLDSKGLAVSTRVRRVSIIRELLRQLHDAPVPLELNQASLRQFLLAERQRLTPASAGVTAVAIRCYLRYRLTCGDQIEHLLPIVASPAHWRLAPLPETLTPTQIEQLLAAFPPDLPSARRGYAIIRCLVDLGMRTSEVAAIELDDIDWRASTLRVAKNKSRRVDLLPLPALTSRAIAEYLQFERPKSAHRRVFVRHVAPVDEPIGSGVIRNTVRHAYLRCGLPFTRVHLLRHTLAGRILNAGGTLKEVADILRHRNLDTSLIYSKIDITRLICVSQPWPGSAS